MRFRIELIQTLSATEPVFATFVHLGVAFSSVHVHSAHRIFCVGLGHSTPAATVMTVDHVRPTSEAHHKVKECSKEQKRQQSSHKASFPPERNQQTHSGLEMRAPQPQSDYDD